MLEESTPYKTQIGIFTLEDGKDCAVDLNVRVDSFQSGPSNAIFEMISRNGVRMELMLSERDTKRLAIQLLMGVL